MITYHKGHSNTTAVKEECYGKVKSGCNFWTGHQFVKGQPSVFKSTPIVNLESPLRLVVDRGEPHSHGENMQTLTRKASDWI